MRKINPDSEKKVAVTDALAALNRRSVKSLTSSMGCSAACSIITNASAKAAVATKPKTVAGLRQPGRGPQ